MKNGARMTTRIITQAPKIHDNRSKEDVFARLQEAGAFEEEEKQRNSK